MAVGRGDDLGRVTETDGPVYRPGGSHWRRWGRSLSRLMVIVMVWLAIVLPSTAQFPTLDTAPIVLDGRLLFEIASTNQIEAGERAEAISAALEEQVTSNDELTVTLETRNKASVIVVNDRYLMTVTQEDARLNSAPSTRSQALQWTAVLNRELATAQEERSHSVLRERVIIALGILLLVLVIDRVTGSLWRRSLRPMLTTATTPHDDGYTPPAGDRKSTRLNSSHRCISYAVFCLKKKKKKNKKKQQTKKKKNKHT